LNSSFIDNVHVYYADDIVGFLRSFQLQKALIFAKEASKKVIAFYRQAIERKLSKVNTTIIILRSLLLPTCRKLMVLLNS